MRYAQITPFEVCNGKEVGVSLFVQGCRFRCKGCFNQGTWDFNGGKTWTEEIENNFFDLISKPYIKRVSILGGEPLANESVSDIWRLIEKINYSYPDKTIWLYTGYIWEEIRDKFNEYEYDVLLYESNEWRLRYQIISNVDILVDGRFEEDKKDLTLKFMGSKNQRIINSKESLREDKVVLYDI